MYKRQGFISSIEHILPYQGLSESKFFLCKHNGVEFLTKLSFYKKTTPEIYSTGSGDFIAVNPHDAEIGILRILKKKIIDGNISPCILELIFHKKCSDIETAVPIQENCDKIILNTSKTTISDTVYGMFCKHNDLVKSGLAHKKFSFLILEECDITFHGFIIRYIESNPLDYAIFKSLMFQIIYTLYAISVIYPDFRHADLHTENVMLKFDPNYKFQYDKPQFMLFTVDGVPMYVPYFGIVCKIIDFGFASIPEENIRSFVAEDRQLMYMRSDNDMLFFLYDIYTVAGTHKSVEKFLKAIEPLETWKHHNTEYIRRHEKEIASYKDMVECKVFDEYKRDPDTIPPAYIFHEYTPV